MKIKVILYFLRCWAIQIGFHLLMGEFYLFFALPLFLIFSVHSNLYKLAMVGIILLYIVVRAVMEKDAPKIIMARTRAYRGRLPPDIQMNQPTEETLEKSE